MLVGATRQPSEQHLRQIHETLSLCTWTENNLCMHGSNTNRCLHFLLLPSPELAGETELFARKLQHVLLIINENQCVTINFN